MPNSGDEHSLEWPILAHRQSTHLRLAFHGFPKTCPTSEARGSLVSLDPAATGRRLRGKAMGLAHLGSTRHPGQFFNWALEWTTHSGWWLSLVAIFGLFSHIYIYIYWVSVLIPTDEVIFIFQDGVVKAQPPTSHSMGMDMDDSDMRSSGWPRLSSKMPTLLWRPTKSCSLKCHLPFFTNIFVATMICGHNPGFIGLYGTIHRKPP